MARASRTQLHRKVTLVDARRDSRRHPQHVGTVVDSDATRANVRARRRRHRERDKTKEEKRANQVRAGA